MSIDLAEAMGLGSFYTEKGGEEGKEKVWAVAPWRLGIQAKYSLYLRGLAYDAVRELEREGIIGPDEAREQKAQVSRDKAAGVYAFGSNLVMESIRSSKDNLARLFWLQVSAVNPDFTLDHSRRLVDQDPEGVIESIFEANDDPNRQTPTKKDSPGSSQESKPTGVTSSTSS